MRRLLRVHERGHHVVHESLVVVLLLLLLLLLHREGLLVHAHHVRRVVPRKARRRHGAERPHRASAEEHVVVGRVGVLEHAGVRVGPERREAAGAEGNRLADDLAALRLEPREGRGPPQDRVHGLGALRAVGEVHDPQVPLAAGVSGAERPDGADGAALEALSERREQLSLPHGLCRPPLDGDAQEERVSGPGLVQQHRVAVLPVRRADGGSSALGALVRDVRHVAERVMRVAVHLGAVRVHAGAVGALGGVCARVGLAEAQLALLLLVVPLDAQAAPAQGVLVVHRVPRLLRVAAELELDDRRGGAALHDRRLQAARLLVQRAVAGEELDELRTRHVLRQVEHVELAVLLREVHAHAAAVDRRALHLLHRAQRALHALEPDEGVTEVPRGHLVPLHFRERDAPEALEGGRQVRLGHGAVQVADEEVTPVQQLRHVGARHARARGAPGAVARGLRVGLRGRSARASAGAFAGARSLRSDGGLRTILVRRRRGAFLHRRAARRDGRSRVSGTAVVQRDRTKSPRCCAHSVPLARCGRPLGGSQGGGLAPRSRLHVHRRSLKMLRPGLYALRHALDLHGSRKRGWLCALSLHVSAIPPRSSVRSVWPAPAGHLRPRDGNAAGGLPLEALRALLLRSSRSRARYSAACSDERSAGGSALVRPLFLAGKCTLPRRYHDDDEARTTFPPSVKNGGFLDCCRNGAPGLAGRA